MKKLVLVAIVFVFLFAAVGTAFAKGFNEFGYNYDARIFNGWYGYYDKDISGGTGDAWLVMKWSQDWTPMADEPVGAWVTNHWSWYSNDCEEGTWYGWETRLPWTDPSVTPNAKYYITEFVKIMKVSDDPDAWAKYQEGGAYDAVWGNYDDGVPKYVGFQDVVSVYERSWSLTGNWTLAFNSTKWPSGNPYMHDMIVTDGTATGGTPAGGTYVNSWSATVSVSGDSVTIVATYLSGSNTYPYTFTAIGTIASDGTISGTWSDTLNDSGSFYSISGNATPNYNNLIATYNLATTSPKGLGHPIF
jgi:hypothetical protein